MKGLCKYFPSNQPTHPVRQASHDEISSGFDHSSETIFETPLYVKRKHCHHFRSLINSNDNG